MPFWQFDWIPPRPAGLPGRNEAEQGRQQRKEPAHAIRNQRRPEFFERNAPESGLRADTILGIPARKMRL